MTLPRGTTALAICDNVNENTETVEAVSLTFLTGGTENAQVQRTSNFLWKAANLPIAWYEKTRQLNFRCSGIICLKTQRSFAAKAILRPIKVMWKFCCFARFHRRARLCVSWLCVFCKLFSPFQCHATKALLRMKPSCGRDNQRGKNTKNHLMAITAGP